MNRKIGAISSIVNLLAVLGFAASMLLRFNFGSYLCSIFIAFSFVLMMCCFLHFAVPERKAAGYAAVAFASVYTAIILLVYFTQLTTVRLGGLTEQAQELLDFQQMNLFFSFDLLGYALMALATFFAGLTICPKKRADKWLRMLLLIHGVFFISCLLLPMLGIFQADSPAWIGVAVLEFWCAYFCPVAILSFLYFQNTDSPQMVITTQNGITTYNGIDRQICHVADGEQRELHISVSRQDGSISISVLQMEEQKYAYRGNDIPTSDFIIALSELGEYCIEINAKDFQGNYGILDCPETQKGDHHDKTCYQNK